MALLIRVIVTLIRRAVQGVAEGNNHSAIKVFSDSYSDVKQSSPAHS